MLWYVFTGGVLIWGLQWFPCWGLSFWDTSLSFGQVRFEPTAIASGAWPAWVLTLCSHSLAHTDSLHSIPERQRCRHVIALYTFNIEDWIIDRHKSRNSYVIILKFGWEKCKICLKHFSMGSWISGGMLFKLVDSMHMKIIKKKCKTRMSFTNMVPFVSASYWADLRKVTPQGCRMPAGPVSSPSRSGIPGSPPPALLTETGQIQGQLRSPSNGSAQSDAAAANTKSKRVWRGSEKNRSSKTSSRNYIA